MKQQLYAFALSGRLHGEHVAPRALPWAMSSMGFQPAHARHGFRMDTANAMGMGGRANPIMANAMGMGGRAHPIAATAIDMGAVPVQSRQMQWAWGAVPIQSRQMHWALGAAIGQWDAP